jgi:MoxR-like ATPase
MGWCELNTTTAPEAHLRSIGAYGFDERAPQILAALVTEDPMLLIGASGTGKTFLLNSLSEALGLEHRHYNASLLSFDDLVGFPFPDAERKCVEFLETPATVWGAESVLVDEISRCKPEHQNRLFSLIHERRLQGIALGRLRYRWAAMNPCSADQDASGAYSGSEPLDQALADRFGLFIQVDDWAGLDEKDQLLIADPSGEGTSSPRNEALKRELARWRADFEEGLPRCPRAIVSYASSAATFLNGNGLRVSPRRARFLSRSLFAITIITGGPLEKAFRNTLAASLPQPTWGASVDQALIEAAHRLAWDSSFLAGDEQWIHHFHTERLLLRKLKLLLKAPSPDAATQAIAEFIGSEAPERVAAFCLATYPAASKGLLGIGAEGVNDLGKVAIPVMSVDAEVSWQEMPGTTQSNHPDYLRFGKILAGLRYPRRTRAAQFFNYLIVSQLSPRDAEGLEAEFEDCVVTIRKHLKTVQVPIVEEEPV